MTCILNAISNILKVYSFRKKIWERLQLCSKIHVRINKNTNVITIFVKHETTLYSIITQLLREVLLLT